MPDHSTLVASQSSVSTQKCGKPVGPNDSQPQKKKPTTQTSETSMDPAIA